MKRIPGDILRAIGLPVPTFSETTGSGLTGLVQDVFGVDVLTLSFIAALYFIASIALVSIVLPNLYFRLILWADATSKLQDDYDYYNYNDDTTNTRSDTKVMPVSAQSSDSNTEGS